MGLPYSNKSDVREDAGLTELELRTSGELWVLRDHGQGTSRASHTINVGWSSIRASKPLLPEITNYPDPVLMVYFYCA
jgi:hypothetical protein